MRKIAIEKKALSIIKETVGLEQPPIDVIRIADYLNADCSEAELPEETSGVLEKHSSGRHTILVNTAHCRERKRFSIAHELGHLLFSERNGLYIDKKIFFRNGRSHEAVDPEEIAANTFAAELLMPSPLVKRALHSYMKDGFLDSGIDVVAKLAESFRVSTTAMSIKLQNMGLTF